MKTSVSVAYLYKLFENVSILTGNEFEAGT